MNASKMKASLALAAMTASNLALAAGGDLGQVDKQPTNWVAISMFAVFVVATLRDRRHAQPVASAHECCDTEPSQTPAPEETGAPTIPSQEPR